MSETNNAIPQVSANADMPGSGDLSDVEKAVLSLLDESGLALTPSNIARNTGYSSGYTRKECNKMADAGLLEKDDIGSHPFYSITEEGHDRLQNTDR